MTEATDLHPQKRSATARRGYHRFVAPGVHWVYLSMALYVTACFLPAMPPIFGTDKVSGWGCLASLIFPIPAWWANPTYFLALILYGLRRHRSATVMAAISSILAYSFEVMNFPNAGWFQGLFKQEVGCYVWTASVQLLFCNLLWQEWIWWRQRDQEAAVDCAAS